MEVINDNYNEFVSLGSQLSGVEGAILRIRKPMEDLQVRLDHLVVMWLTEGLEKPA